MKYTIWTKLDNVIHRDGDIEWIEEQETYYVLSLTSRKIMGRFNSVIAASQHKHKLEQMQEAK